MAKKEVKAETEEKKKFDAFPRNLKWADEFMYAARRAKRGATYNNGNPIDDFTRGFYAGICDEKKRAQEKYKFLQSRSGSKEGKASGKEYSKDNLPF